MVAGKVELWVMDHRNMGYDNQHYTVEKATNSVDWKMGQWLSTQDVQDIINSGVKVNVLQYKPGK